MVNDKRIAVVTGGLAGIGAAIRRRLREAGYHVVVMDLQADPAGDPAAISVDVTVAAQVDQAFREVEQRFGPITVLCNNAGVSTMRPVVDLSEDEWDFNFSVNVKGVFLCTRAALRTMIPRQNGVIVNTASMAGLRGVPLLAHYAASKWAVIGFTKSVALEVARYGIRVNAVCPGYVKTSMQEREIQWESTLRGITPEEVLAYYVRLTPMGRLEEPEDVADVVALLASPSTKFMTGVAVPVTGGADL